MSIFEGVKWEIGEIRQAIVSCNSVYDGPKLTTSANVKPGKKE